MTDLQKKIANLPPEKQALLLRRLQEERGVSEHDTIKHRERTDDACPLSFAQQRLWFLNQFEPGTSTYSICRAFFLHGPLNVSTLEQSFNEVIRRHELLRTTFLLRENLPVQVISPFTFHPLPIVAVIHEEEALQVAGEEARRPFDLTRGPLLRFTLLRLQNGTHVLLLTMHHIIADGWSFGVLFREITACYQALSASATPSLPPLPIQYSDYALWQRTWLQGQVLEKQLAFWKKELEDAPSVLNFPVHSAARTSPASQGALIMDDVPYQIADALKRLMQSEQATSFMILLAAFQVLVFRYSGQEDFLLGTPIANRNRTELEGLIGYVANTLVIRARLTGNPSFRTVLQRVRSTALAAYAHQDLPFERLVEELQPERDPGRTPLIQVMFSPQNEPDTPFALPNMQVRSQVIDTGSSSFLLTFVVDERLNRLHVSAQYKTDRISAETIRRLFKHYRVLLAGIAANPDCRISALPLLTPDEQEQIVDTWNATATDYPRHSCIHQIFEEQVRRTPQAIALCSEEQVLTYQEVNRRANQLAWLLRSLDVGPEIPVSIALSRSFGLIISQLAILKAGGAYVPLDPGAPAGRLAFILKETQTPLILRDVSAEHPLPTSQATSLTLDQLQAGLAAFPETNLPCNVSAQHLAAIIYTSGSTGQPKGVAITHQNVMRLVQQMNYAHITTDDRFLLNSSIAFDVSTFEIWGPLLNGAQLVLPGSDRLSLHELGQLIQRECITTLWLTAGLFHQMVDYEMDGLRDVRHLLAGGDALSPSHTLKLLKNLSPGAQLTNGYGPTENTTFTTCYAMTEPEQVSEGVPIGRPVANTQVYILDRALQPVPAWVVGELYTGGDGVTRGYLSRPELTAERFIPDLWGRKPGARLYKTGDLARYRLDGVIEFLGRYDTQVKIRGFRIELEEIEAVLSSSGLLQNWVVLARQDAQQEKYLAAYIVPWEESEQLQDQLYGFLQGRLPDYMLPSAWVVLKSLPLTTNGKVDRRALPAPDLELARQRHHEYVAPHTQLEESLAGIWATVLHVQHAGIYDNFFDLGGHSLSATQVISRIRTALHIDLPLRLLFEAPTIAGLAEHINRLQHARHDYQLPPLQTYPRPARLPLSFPQQRLYFLDQLEPGNAVYTLPCNIRVTGTLHIAALEQSLRSIEQRHEALRTIFPTVEDTPVQVITSVSLLTLARTDLSSLPSADRESEARRLMAAEARLPFDLQRGPLWRAHLLRLDMQHHIIFITMHHIVSDGWSLNIFFRELALLYEAAAQGHTSPLLPLPLQYADYAVWQQHYLQSKALEDQCAYWKQQLTGAPMALELPTRQLRPAVQTYAGARHFFVLPAELVARLRKLVLQEDCTLFMLLLAAFEVLIYQYTERTDFLIGSPSANRTQTETEHLVGFFITTLVLRANLAGNPRFTEVLKRVRETVLGAYAHQELPFEKLVEVLQPERDPSRNPLYQIEFVFNNVVQLTRQLPDLQMQLLRTDNGASQFDLTFALSDSDEGLYGTLTYNTDLFDEGAILRMEQHYQRVLARVLEDPEQHIIDLSPLAEDEYRQLLSGTPITLTEIPAVKEHIMISGRQFPEDIAISILNTHLRPVPTGIPGELYLHIPAQEHEERPRSPASFAPHPMANSPAAHLYRTGDIVRRLSNGSLQFLGRADSVCHIAGLRVHPEAIEAVLQKHQAVQHAIVRPWSDNQKKEQLVAYIVSRAEHELSIRQLRNETKAQLPAYLQPARFIVLANVPRDRAGQIDYQLLPLPPEQDTADVETQATPQTALGKALAQIWRDVLQREHVSLNETFFEQGGHSLLLLQVHRKLSQYVQQPISIVDLFKYPTINALVEYISSQQSQSTSLQIGQRHALARIEALQRRQRLHQRDQELRRR